MILGENSLKKSYGAVIAAGGSGIRFGSDMPKQFVDALGVPVIAHTIAAFEACREIDKIVIVTHRDYLVFTSDVVKEFAFRKVTAIIEGGPTRQNSVYKGLKTIDTDYVLIHDAARPLITPQLLSRCCAEVTEFGACAVGSKAIDTIKHSEDGKYISSTLDRSKLWHIQTPQCFDREFILKCHKNSAFEGFEATDDCMLAERYGARIKLLENDNPNLKITNFTDLAVAEVLLRD